MSAKVDLYDSAYANYASEVYRQVRIETYGEDFGQTGWTTTEESREIPSRLDLKPDSSVLEFGCGSGGYALYLAQTVGCRLVGLDINEPGVQNATNLLPPEVSVKRFISNGATLRRGSPLRTELLMRCSRMMSCAILQDVPKCSARCFAF